MSSVCENVWRFHCYIFEDLLDGSAEPVITEEDARNDLQNLSGPDSMMAFVVKVLGGLQSILQNEVCMSVCVFLCARFVYLCLHVCMMNA
jgi:hypothetical protein